MSVDDRRNCSLCGTHIGVLGNDYCDPCDREIGRKPPRVSCLSCGVRAPQPRMQQIDVSPEEKYYPEIRYLCRDCGGDGS